jgi:hypothetical protein
MNQLKLNNIISNPISQERIIKLRGSVGDEGDIGYDVVSQGREPIG